MNNKYDRLYNDFEEHLLTIVSNEENWKSFFDTVGNTSKYKFSEQVLINNQKPTATACADETEKQIIQNNDIEL